MQKGFTLTYLIIGILVTALVLSGVYIYKLQTQKDRVFQDQYGMPIIVPSQALQQNNKPTPETKPDDRADETASWKTYTNTKLKFEFRYPENYKFEREDSGKATFSGTFGPGNQIIPSELVVYFSPTLNLKTLKNCKDARFEANISTTCIVDGEVNVKNVGGIQMNTFHISVGLKESMPTSSYVYQTVNQPKIEFIHKVLGGGVETRVDKILSTFKFN
ncbi:MAG: hypothetical protein Q7S88_02030 [Candidatus Daviesbacteria bacterium]|nr:hypothetical protein [Candidatus Daviesbacteria bacterium]